jgi:hypothetical protein
LPTGRRSGKFDAEVEVQVEVGRASLVALLELILLAARRVRVENSPAILMGRIFDDRGNRMTPKPTLKQETRDAILLAIAQARSWIDDLVSGRFPTLLGWLPPAWTPSLVPAATWSRKRAFDQMAVAERQGRQAHRSACDAVDQVRVPHQPANRQVDRYRGARDRQ